MSDGFDRFDISFQGFRNDISRARTRIIESSEYFRTVHPDTDVATLLGFLSQAERNLEVLQSDLVNITNDEAEQRICGINLCVEGVSGYFL